MIPFPFNENQFSFFVADHQLVGQLCTNPKSDRSLLKVTQYSTSEIGDAPLYNLCPLLIQAMTTGPLPTPSKWKSGRFNVPRVMKSKFLAIVMVFGVVSSEGHIMPPHIFEVGLKVNTKVYLDMLKSVVIPGCNQVAGSRPGCGSRTQRWPTSPKSPGLATEGVLRLCTLLSLPCSDLNPLDYLVWSYVENITIMTSHNTKANLIAAAIRRVSAELPSVLVEKACPQFRIHIEVVTVAEVGYIK